MESVSEVLFVIVAGMVILLFTAVWLLLLYWFIRGAVHLVLAIRETNENYDKLRMEKVNLRFNPVNVLLYPTCLTEKGLEYRREGFRFISRFLIVAVLVLVGGEIFKHVLQ